MHDVMGAAGYVIANPPCRSHYPIRSGRCDPMLHAKTIVALVPGISLPITLLGKIGFSPNERGKMNLLSNGVRR